MLDRLNASHIHLAMGIGCLALLADAIFYLQGKLGLLPCPLCVMQRFAYILVAATALLAALHRPAGAGRWLYGGLMLAWSTAGAAVAGWQVYLIHQPHAASCGISAEERFLNALPLATWWPSMFEANGDCTKVDWTFLGLSIPELSLLAFVALAAAAVLAVRRAR